MLKHSNTVPATAIELGRQGWGAELNPVYYDIAVGYCKDAEVKASMPTLFELAAD